MQSDWYTLLSMGMRYWFTAIAAIIVFRAWQATIRDTRRARVLRAWAPDTGAIGEIVVMAGGSGVRKGTRIPVPKEGLLGASRRSDVRLKHPDVKRYHAHIEQRENGVLMEAMGRAEIWLAGRTGQKLLLRDGDCFSIGGLALMLVLYAPGDEMDSVDVDIAEDELFSPAGLGASKGARLGKIPQGELKKNTSAKKKSASADFMEEIPDSATAADEKENFRPGKSRKKARTKRKKARKTPAADELFMPFEEDVLAARKTSSAGKKAGKTAKKKEKEPDEEVYWWQDGKR